MYLKRLQLRNFRNIEEEAVDFDEGVNLIQGGNAQGKTSLLEALYFLSTGRSFRTNRLTDLIKHKASFFYLEASFVKEDVPQTLKVSFDGQVKRLQVNQTSYSNFSPLLGILPSVLYAPSDRIVSGAPADRRRFLDMHIAQIDPLYVHHLLRYYKAMKQRNALLKVKSEAAIESWEEMMTQSANYISKMRQTSIEELAPKASSIMKELSDHQDKMALRYDHKIYTLETWKNERPKELEVGTTLIGPHRDDLLILLSGKPAKHFSSEGQKRTVAAALRFAQWHQLKQTTDPLMSIDDFCIHLDPKRKELMHAQVKQMGQVFLTSPTYLDSLRSHVIAVHEGKLHQVETL